MSRVIERGSFDPSSPVVSRRQFTAGGRSYPKGTPFPWKRLSVSQRRVKQMYDSGLLAHGESEAVDIPDLVDAPNEEANNQDESGGVANDVSPVDHVGTDGPGESDTVEVLPVAEYEAMKMPELREVAKSIGAPLTQSKADQIDAILATFDSMEDDG